jgi:hypothetical protein
MEMFPKSNEPARKEEVAEPTITAAEMMRRLRELKSGMSAMTQEELVEHGHELQSWALGMPKMTTEERVEITRELQEAVAAWHAENEKRVDELTQMKRHLDQMLGQK